MTPVWPRVAESLVSTAVIRSQPEDFQVREELGFEPSGAGEHAFLYLEKRGLNTSDLIRRVSQLSGIAPQHIGYSGLKDRNALTSQWVSVGLAGASEPAWKVLEEPGDVRVLRVERHAKKLKRGVHRLNHFQLTLRGLSGSRPAFETALQSIGQNGVPNYFGEQRFGRSGATLRQARLAINTRRKLSRKQRSLYYSALRAHLFNTLLAARVENGTWDQVQAGDACSLAGTRSLFTCENADDTMRQRVASGDVHPALPLWGKGDVIAQEPVWQQQRSLIAHELDVCDYLERAGLSLSWRATRLLPSDFCWQFCDDGSLQMKFALGAGGYATALLSELVDWEDARLPAAQVAVTRHANIDQGGALSFEAHDQKDKIKSDTGSE
ncbi:MAG: tRNA pseudouridine(13) synthase TruD [Halioglobus sp.]